MLSFHGKNSVRFSVNIGLMQSRSTCHSLFSCTYRLDRLYEEVLDAERVGSKQDLLTNMEYGQIETDACFGNLDQI